MTKKLRRPTVNEMEVLIENCCFINFEKVEWEVTVEVHIFKVPHCTMDAKVTLQQQPLLQCFPSHILVSSLSDDS